MLHEGLKNAFSIQKCMKWFLLLISWKWKQLQCRWRKCACVLSREFSSCIDLSPIFRLLRVVYEPQLFETRVYALLLINYKHRGGNASNFYLFPSVMHSCIKSETRTSRYHRRWFLWCMPLFIAKNRALSTREWLHALDRVIAIGLRRWLMALPHIDTNVDSKRTWQKWSALFYFCVPNAPCEDQNQEYIAGIVYKLCIYYLEILASRPSEIFNYVTR